MSHYFTIPITTDGLIADLNVAGNFTKALNPPFNISDVFIYSHGWWTSATAALGNYNQFSIELSELVGTIMARGTSTLTRLPASPLGVAVHWPSMISDDDSAILNKLEPFSFYAMGQRANKVGENSVYALLRLIIEQAPSTPRIHFLGHSFGCRVVCSAIQEILKDSQTIPNGNNLAVNAVLLEAAFDQNDLEAGGVYGGLSQMPNLRVLSTYSALDNALCHAYPLSQEINIFKGPGKNNEALGGRGPTAKTLNDFGSVAAPLIVLPGSDYSISSGLPARFIAADITALHQASTSYDNGNPDHHSDIYLPELYELICGFLFR
jgi:hypothetical protein